jgi:hypothetical protein
MTVLGVEALHTWETGLVLNDQAAWPRYWVSSITGLHSLADFSGLSDPRIGRPGEIPRRDYRRGKTISYEGDILGRTLIELREAEQDLLAAFATNEEKRMDVEPPPAFTAGVPRFFRARPISCDTVDLPSSPDGITQHVRGFGLVLRMYDPRFYDPTVVEEATGTPSGGAATVTVDNTGNADADPVIALDGPLPADDTVLENLTTGKGLVFRDGLAVASGEVLTLDFFNRTVDLDGANRYGLFDEGLSSWWDEDEFGLIPGENEIRLSGTGLTNPAKATITFFPPDFG